MASQIKLVKVTHPAGDFEIPPTEDEYFRFESDKTYRDSTVNNYLAQILQPADHTVSVEVAKQHRAWTVEDEETLIKLVSERPSLYDHSLPLRQGSKLIVKNLWKEIIDEMNVDLDEEVISKKWKNIRDSYMRARSNINKKSSSGSSAETRIQTEKIKKNHKHYELLTFLDRSLAARRTTSNLGSASGVSAEIESSQRSPVHLETPSTFRQGEFSSSRGRGSRLSSQDEAFLEAIKDLRPVEKSPIEQFCSRLADGLSKLPLRVSNQLQMKFLAELIGMENLHLDS